MNNLVKEFENAEFGKVRVVMQENKPWFVAKDVCDVLEISKYRDALTRLDDDERGSVEVDTLGGKQNMASVNEYGLYSLVLGSRKPEAKEFKRWITHEVLPSIRNTGLYNTCTELSPQLQLLINMELQQKEQERQLNEMKSMQEKQREELHEIREVAAWNPGTEWRKHANKLIAKMGNGDGEQIRSIRNEAYDMLESRFSVLLETRLRNMRRRMAEEGVSKTKRDALTKVDVIAADKKLIEGYILIVKEMAIKYGVTV